MVDDTLDKYVQQALAAGQSKEQIYLVLLQKSHTVVAIEKAFPDQTPEVASAQAPENTHDKVVKLVIFIGVILVGAGIFSFIAANWQEMTRVVKLSVILISMLISYGAGWYFRTQKQLHKISDGLMLLGCVIYGSGIFLIAQMFNVRANWPDGFIIWMVGALALAFVLESSPLFMLAITTAIAALIGHPFIIFESLSDDPFLMTSATLLLIAADACLGAGLILKKKLPPAIKELY